ncbi:hypothetical protein B0J17DRAFT_703255 [Rhizoctonia solani]|nr:hypothetical protein B0J17DRAFT_703255 [Rhizoctonia solani]
MGHTISQYVNSEPLASGIIVGLAVSSTASLVSLVSVLYFGGRVVVGYKTNIFYPGVTVMFKSFSSWVHYVLNWWYLSGGHRGAYCGSTCDAQGGLAQTWRCVFNIGTKPYSLFTWVSVAIATWGIVGLFAVIGWSLHPDFYEPAPLCRPRCFASFILLIFIWICGFGNTFVYVLWYLLSRGNLYYERGANDSRLKWTWSPRAPDDAAAEAQRSEAWKMLLYPWSYSFLALGFSIASGVVTVGLILLTRPNILLHGVRVILLPKDPGAEREYELRWLGK